MSRCQREIKINIDLSIHLLIHHPPEEKKIRGITMSVNYKMIYRDGRKIGKDRLICKNAKILSFVFVLKRTSPRLRRKEGVMRFGTDQNYAGWI